MSTDPDPRLTRRAPVGVEQLAALSHEFRTPLNGVLGMARLLEGTSLTQEQRTYVTALRDSGEHLLGLVNDLLDFAKLGASRVELHTAPVEVESLLRGVCELLSPRARERNLEIAWAASAGIGSIVADEARLRQILLNFAGNGIKFTQTGGVFITASMTGAESVRFEVSDTGPGVRPADQARIFEAFTQADPVRDHAQLGGAGLGLAIARTLATVMAGNVGVTDAPGGGALFWFEAAFPHSPELASAELGGQVIGLMTSNPITAKAARRQIEASGGRAVVAQNTHQPPSEGAVLLVDHELAPSGPPDARPALILLDPEARGQIEAYRTKGFVGYLIKPLRRASVAARVLAALGEGVQKDAEDDRVASATAPGAKVLLVEDNAINALLARTLLNREGCTVDHAAGGDEALAAVSVGAYDLILMDMRMPGLSGLETTVKVRELGVATPIVALTANAFEDDRHACLDAGMDDFLVKPLSAEALRRVLMTMTKGGWTSVADRVKLA